MSGNLTFRYPCVATHNKRATDYIRHNYSTANQFRVLEQTTSLILHGSRGVGRVGVWGVFAWISATMYTDNRQDATQLTNITDKGSAIVA